MLIVAPTPLSEAAGLSYDPSLELRVLADRMSVLAQFLQPFISAGEPWVMQFVALTRTLAVSASPRAFSADALARSFDFEAVEEA